MIYSTVNDETPNVSRPDMHWYNEISAMNISCIFTISFSTGSQQGHNHLQYYWWCFWEWSSRFYRNIGILYHVFMVLAIHLKWSHSFRSLQHVEQYTAQWLHTNSNTEKNTGTDPSDQEKLNQQQRNVVTPTCEGQTFKGFL